MKREKGKENNISYYIQWVLNLLNLLIPII